MPADAMEGLREGLRFGGEDFLEQLIERVELKLGEGHGRKERLETGEQKAERIVCEELERLKWRESDISKESKGRPQKVEIARRIREETTMSLKWIAIRLKMGGWKHVANKLDQNEKCTDTQRQDFSERACQVK